MESVTWTAQQKMVTAVILWTQQGKTGEIQQLYKLYEMEMALLKQTFFIFEIYGFIWLFCLWKSDKCSLSLPL